MFGDESAFYLLPCVVKTWAKVGCTPVLRAATRRDHLSVASAISWDGRLVTRVQKSAFNGASVAAFLKHLLRRIPGKVVLIWDGAKIHHCQAVKDFLSAGAARRLRLVPLPAYAPELNPDEGVWRWLKRALGNVCCKDVTELRYELGLAVARLRRRPEVIRSFFAGAGLPI
jgi:transposase